MNDNLKAAIYVRVSTEEQARDDKTSLAEQERRCRALCNAHDWDVTNVYRDVTSGAKWERPDLQRLLRDGSDKAFDKVVFLAIDRFGRDLKDLLISCEHLRDRDVGIVSVKETFDTSTAAGKLFFHLLGAFAEFERSRITERMMDGRIAKVKAGNYYTGSKRPYGYVFENGVPVPHSDEADIVRQLYEWAPEIGTNACAQRLNERGAEPPTRRCGRKPKCENCNGHGWSASTIYKLLTDPLYVGRPTFKIRDANKKVVEERVMPCEPIVDELTFEKAKESLARRKKHSSRKTKRERVYLLQHLLRCRHCGSSYVAYWRDRYLYACRKRWASKKAGHEGVVYRFEGHETEARVITDLREAFRDPEVAERRISEFLREVGARDEEHRARIAGLTKKLNEVAEREARALDAYERGVYKDEAQFYERLGKVRDEIEATKRALDDERAVKVPIRKPIEELKRNIDDVLGWTGVEDRKGWYKRLHDMLETIWVEADGSFTYEGLLNVRSHEIPMYT